MPTDNQFEKPIPLASWMADWLESACCDWDVVPDQHLFRVDKDVTELIAKVIRASLETTHEGTNEETAWLLRNNPMAKAVYDQARQHGRSELDAWKIIAVALGSHCDSLMRKCVEMSLNMPAVFFKDRDFANAFDEEIAKRPGTIQPIRREVS